MIIRSAVTATFALLAFYVSASAAESSNEFALACVNRIGGNAAQIETVRAYCSCAEAQRQGQLDDRDQRAVNDALKGKKDAFRSAYPELSKEQFALRLDALDAILARLAKQTDEKCGQPRKSQNPR